MIKNLGGLDRIIRLLIAVACGALIAVDLVNGALALVVAIAGMVMVLTSVLGWCPLYGMTGLSTRRSAD